MVKLFVLLGSVMMFLGVAAGAFGAHGLSDYFSQHPNLESTFETAVRYQIYHALGLFAFAWAVDRWDHGLLNWGGLLIFFGMLIFSGSLYLLVLTRTRWLGAITPIGGVAMLAGWAILFITIWRVA